MIRSINAIAVTACLGAFLALVPAIAQDEPSYRVELLVFRHLTAAVADDETWGSHVERATQSDSGRSDVVFRPLPKDELKLVEAYETMRRSRDYQPLLHVGWIQPGLPRADAPAHPVGGSAGGYAVSGFARLILERRLRLDLDLIMAGSNGEQYELVDGRPLRRGDMHYFDHPRFGVIAVVTRE